MDSVLTHALEVAAYTRSNVLPSSRVRPPRAVAHFDLGVRGALYSPSAVHPLQDSGGFNSVIELSASTCRRQAGAAMHPAVLDCALAVDAYHDLVRAAAPIGQLAAMQPSLPSLAPLDEPGFRLEITLRGLTFPDPQSVVLAFGVTLAHLYPALPQPETPPLVPKETWDPTWPMQSFDMRPGSAREGPADPTARSVRSAAFIRDRAPSESEGLSQPAEAEGPVRRGRMLIGAFTAELRAPLGHRDEPGRCRTPWRQRGESGPRSTSRQGKSLTWLS